MMETLRDLVKMALIALLLLGILLAFFAWWFHMSGHLKPFLEECKEIYASRSRDWGGILATVCIFLVFYCQVLIGVVIYFCDDQPLEGSSGQNGNGETCLC